MDRVREQNEKLYPKRKVLRLRNYDYSQAGVYFVTICTKDKECLLGKFASGEIAMNDVASAVLKTWTDLLNRFHGIALDSFVIMPNHVHGIIVIGNDTQSTNRQHAGAASSAPTDLNLTMDVSVPHIFNHAPTLGRIVRAFKSISAIHANRFLSRFGHPFWQRNYYERVIRDGDELNRYRDYIVQNPIRWAEDKDNPANLKEINTL